MRLRFCLGRNPLAAALAVGVLATGLLAQATPTNSIPPSLYETSNGRGVIQLNEDALTEMGISISTARNQDVTILPLTLGPDSRLGLATFDRNFATFVGGSADLSGNAVLNGPNGDTFTLRHPEVLIDEAQGGTSWTLRADGIDVFHFVSPSLVELDTYNGRMSWSEVEVLVAMDLANQLGISDAAGQSIGSLTVEASVAPTGSTVSVEAVDSHPASSGGTARGIIGPDVIVGSLPDTSNWGTSGGIRAYSVGTTSCNIGDVNLNWFSNTNQHPVIGQSLYRYKDGKFEHIGQSWLKHGFFALSGSLCFNDCQGTSGSQLGVHCSDPYSSGLNGSRSGLGPKFQVNATTGDYPYPPTQPSSNSTIGRRLQVDVDDIDAAQNVGARYFVEGHYVTPDDAAAGNAENNASYREVNLVGSSRNMSFVGSTVREKPAIEAWPTIDAGVTRDVKDIANDGRMIVMSNATNIGGNTWHYEYAVHNLNSHRSGQSFSVPLPVGSVVSNVGYHDVDYHSGNPYTNADWNVNIQPDSITWSTETFAQNEDANALRWGTLYNFRFDLDRGPESGMVNLGLFRPGTPSDIDAVAQVPMGGPVPDLHVKLVRVDYDPSDGDIDAGPGGLGQDIEVLVTVTNPGNIPITRADIGFEASVNGGNLIADNTVVTDFDTIAGTQSLAPGGIFSTSFFVSGAQLDRCGHYDLHAFHNGSTLEADASGFGQGILTGDLNSENDEVFDVPDEFNSPNDGFTPDLIRIEFGTIAATIQGASEIIENPATERVKIDIDYVGLGPGGDSHDVELRADLLDTQGNPVYTDVFMVARTGVRSNGMRMTGIRLNVSNLQPPPAPGTEFIVRLRLRDTNSTSICIETETVNTTTIQ